MHEIVHAQNVNHECASSWFGFYDSPFDLPRSCVATTSKSGRLIRLVNIAVNHLDIHTSSIPSSGGVMFIAI